MLAGIEYSSEVSTQIFRSDNTNDPLSCPPTAKQGLSTCTSFHSALPVCLLLPLPEACKESQKQISISTPKLRTGCILPKNEHP